MVERTWMVLGAPGLVGSHCVATLLSRGENVVAVAGRARPVPASWAGACREVTSVDLADGAAVGQLVAGVRPDVVLHCAGATAVDRCEAEPEWAATVNAASVDAVRSGLSPEAVLAYVSTDYVFDGDDGPYSEEDRPMPVNRYGESKLAGERTAGRHPQHLVARTTVVYGRELHGPGTGSLAQLLRAAGEGRPFNAPVDEVGTPTYAGRLAEDLVDLVVAGGRGMFHLAGCDLVSRYEYARRAALALGLDADMVVAVEGARLGRAARRPARHGLLCGRAESHLGRPMGGLDHGLARAAEDMLVQAAPA